MIQDIVESATPEEIINFAYTYHPTTKHHLHLFSHSAEQISSLPDEPLGLLSLVRSERTATQALWFYLIELSYNVVLRDPLEIVPVKFPWPVLIRCTNDLLTLRFTIMEPSMASRFDSGRIVKATREIDESTVQAQALGNLGLSNVTALDLNKGVKGLWSDDMIDSPSVQWKKARATTRQVMDGDYLVKRDDPDLYQELVDKPLFGALFRWVGDSISLEHFTVEATQGTFTFRTFSDLDKGADYVVREILERN